MAATLANASSKWAGNVLPRFSARRRMPRAARADSEYLAGTVCGGSRIVASDGSEDEHAPSALRHSEETAVENPPRHAVPEVGQRVKNDSEVPTAVAREEAGYVLDENPSGSNKVDDTGELTEQPGSFPGESGASSGDGEVLAGEPAAEKINSGGFDGNRRSIPLRLGASSVGLQMSGSSPPAPRCDFAYVVVDGHSGPPGGKHLSPPRIGLAEEDMPEPGSCESVVEAADPAEHASGIHFTEYALA